MQANHTQAEYWSSKSGRKWIEFEGELDVVFGAVDQALVEWSEPSPGESVLDIGCGTGATSRLFASRVAPGGRLSAVDISPPLIEQARQRAKEEAIDAQYLLADAQTAQFPTAPFDLVISRFGSMFFADPVAAFVNIRSQIKPGGRMVLAAWASAQGNPWFEVPKDGAVERLGPPEPSDPNAPGPLAFQNAGRVTGLLEEAGFEGVTGETIPVTLAHPGPLQRVAALASNIGPAARILKQYAGSAEDVQAITDYVTASFRRFEGDEGIRIPANLNVFTARNPV